VGERYNQVWAPDNGHVPFHNNLRWGNALSHKLKLGERRVLASHFTYWCTELNRKQLGRKWSEQEISFEAVPKTVSVGAVPESASSHRKRTASLTLTVTKIWFRGGGVYSRPILPLYFFFPSLPLSLLFPQSWSDPQMQLRDLGSVKIHQRRVCGGCICRPISVKRNLKKQMRLFLNVPVLCSRY